MKTTSIVFRGPAREDAEALGHVHYLVWRATYAETMDPAAFAALSPERFAAGWRRRLSNSAAEDIDTPGELTRVAVHDVEGIVGFVSIGAPRETDGPATRQLLALNLLPSHHGTGLADRMMVEVVGEGPAYLWVARGNDRAIRFFRRHGFIEDGAEVCDDQDGITEIRMVRRG